MILLGLAVLLVFAAGFLLDTAGVIQLGYICATGGCGVSPVWLAAALGAGVGLWMTVSLARRLRARRSPRKKSRTGARRKPPAPAKAKPAARRAGRRKAPARA